MSGFFSTEGKYRMAWGKEDGSCVDGVPYALAADEAAAAPGTVGTYHWLSKTVFPNLHECGRIWLQVEHETDSVPGRRYEVNVGATEPAL